ncbi:hypothetical protein [Bacillus haynesii]|uniref:hypothetical protein n=1 Tax=Bacillus haynesii TaxID=1925021 RepID=UPI002280D612|nr:hypothetical protein [Bacillus haynesii]MCY9434148.1 hypothetical protein [Bacillus haynesii]MEC0754586.1 hypothetical protein [Bacillus haynesii]
MPKFEWNEQNENLLMQLREKEKKSHAQIAEILGTTISSVKHKYVRLNQAKNEDKHHHPKEKIEQIDRVLDGGDYFILETNAGWGNLTKHYKKYAKNLIVQDIEKKKVEFIKSQNWKSVEPIKCDSFKEIHKYIWSGVKFDVIDVDPYGFPSRYFPHIFQLIDDGYLFITFPKMGVQQINKIMIEHYRVFWGVTLTDKEVYKEKIHRKIEDYALQYYRRVALVDFVDLGRMFRFAYKVKKESALELVNLNVNRQ